MISSKPTSMYLASLETEWTTTSDSLSNKCYVASDMAPMSQLYTNNVTATHTRSSTVLMRTGSNGTTTIMPIDKKADEWKPGDNAKMDAFPTVIMTEDAAVQDNKYLTSYVVAFASTNIINKEWTSNSAVANLNFTLDVFNTVSGITDNPFNFVAKTISSENYYVYVTKANEIAIRVIFMGIIPVALLVTGIVVWARRRTR